MKTMKRLLAVLAALAILAPMTVAFAAEDGYSSTYTYNYDYWGELRESPDAYRVTDVIYSSSLALDKAMRSPKSLFVRDQDLYIVDTGNNRILHLTRTGASFDLVRVIDQVTVGADKLQEFMAASDLMKNEDGSYLTDEDGSYYLKPPVGSSAEKGPLALTSENVTYFNNPNDVSVDPEGKIYVADRDNNRVIVMNKDLEFVQLFTKPSDSTFDQNQSFLPNKLVVDTSGRVFVLANNINKGLVKFEADGTFTGFIGANPVTYNLWDYIWKTYFMTKEQRSQQAAFVPTEYQNIYIDNDGFIYATNTSFSEYDLLWDNAKPIRLLNAVGQDILVKNDRYPPIGDLEWVEQSSDHGPSKLYDITVLDNDVYVVIDQTRGRVFGYDPQGIMLWAFGTSGVNAEGVFSRANSIEHMGTDLLVLDELDCSVTVFSPTEYGNLIFLASEQYLRGDYDGSADTWEKVLQHNANYNLAFIGIGRSKMRAEEYEEAMALFKMAHDRDNYGQAFRYYRKIWVEKNILWVVLIIVVLVVFSFVRKTIRKVKWEVAAYEHNKVAK
ncbi:MAG: hypothetical protein K5919_07525 [Clostridiales bacterium]|nr:hypothetical protein [Clostridiales bacterium]